MPSNSKKKQVIYKNKTFERQKFSNQNFISRNTFTKNYNVQKPTNINGVFHQYILNNNLDFFPIMHSKSKI
jgi:hypothetical protein